MFQKVQIASSKVKECGEGELAFKKSIVVGVERKRREELLELQILGKLSFMSVSFGLLSLS